MQISIENRESSVLMKNIKRKHMVDINKLKILGLFYAKNKDTILRSPSCDTVSPLSVYFKEKIPLS